MQWVRLGDHDRRTKAGRQIMAALRTRGEGHAAAMAQRLAVDAIRSRPRTCAGSNATGGASVAGGDDQPQAQACGYAEGSRQAPADGLRASAPGDGRS
jgi:hypothetical protein